MKLLHRLRSLRIVVAIVIATILNIGWILELIDMVSLQRVGIVAEGVILESSVETDEGDYGSSNYSTYTYTFKDKNGDDRETFQVHEGDQGYNYYDCPCPVAIRYLADNPEVNSINELIPKSLVSLFWEMGMLGRVLKITLYSIGLYFLITRLARPREP